MQPSMRCGFLTSVAFVREGERPRPLPLDELMDAAAPPEVVQQIRALAGDVEKVDLVQKCVVRRPGYHYFVDLHLHVDPQMTVAESHRIAHQVKDKLREEMPRVRDVLVHIEPRASVPNL